MYRVVSVLAILLHVVAAESSGEDCIRTLHDLKESYLSRKDNTDSMQRALLPPNSPSHFQINIYYHFTTTVEKVCSNSSQYSEACNSEPIHLEALPFDYKFRWSSSSVHNFIRPRLLQSLSLYTYQAETTEAHVLIDPICSSGGARSFYTCHEHEQTHILSPELELRLLNELTCHIKSFTLYEMPFDMEKTKGYSVLYDSCTTEDYQVLYHQEFYQDNRTVLTVCLICLGFFFSLGTPHILVYMYDPIQKAVIQHSVTQYLIWGIATTSFFMAPLILAQDFHAVIARGYYERSIVPDVRTKYIIGFTSLVFFPLLSAASTISLCYTHHGDIREDFPVPTVIEWTIKKSCLRFSTMSSKVIAQYLGIFSFTGCLELLAAHMVYILLAIVASPIPTTSFLLLYGAAVFVLVVFCAFSLKAADSMSSVDNNINDASSSAEGNDRQRKHPSCKEWVCYVSHVLAGIAFLGFIFSFIAFIIRVNIQVEQYNRDSILATLITTLIPSASLAIIGYVAKKALEVQTGTMDPGQHREPTVRSGEMAIPSSATRLEQGDEDTDTTQLLHVEDVGRVEIEPCDPGHEPVSTDTVQSTSV